MMCDYLTVCLILRAILLKIFNNFHTKSQNLSQMHFLISENQKNTRCVFYKPICQIKHDLCFMPQKCDNIDCLLAYRR